MRMWWPDDKVFQPAPLAAGALDLEDAKEHLRVLHDDDDSLITAFVQSATAHVEAYTQRLLIARDCTLRLRCLPSCRTAVAMPGGRVSAVALITAGEVSVIGFEVLGDSPARLIPDEDWPATEYGGFPVSIAYTAGFETVPADLLQAVRMITGELYNHRDSSSEAVMQALPIGPYLLMKPHRILAA
jgi:uncharacterized phiE125 gp8 family phage protein